MNILDRLGKELLYFEGAMGTELQKRGLAPSELPETWNVAHPDVISEIHLSYINSGCNIVKLNTFGANSFKYDEKSLRAVIEGAVSCAKRAVSLSGKDDVYLALDIGPCGKLLAPYGSLPFEEAVSLFAQTVKIGAEYGVDLILIETMNDLYETKAAVLAAKENSSLPIFVTNAYDEGGTLMTGASPEAVVCCLEGLGVDALGLNCSWGPREMLPVVKRLSACSSTPLIVCPNAGIPTIANGKTVFDIKPDEFAGYMYEIASLGVHVVGGCCGTNPEYMKAMIDRLSGFAPKALKPKNKTWVSSYTHAVEFGKIPLIIGERINPTGKKAFKAALKSGDTDYILNEGITQADAGAHILDVNVGLPEIDETAVMENIVTSLQAVCDLPLQIDSSDPKTIERALRLYNGKAMVNSVNASSVSMENIFPIVKKYGGLVVALTLDEKGIPDTAAGRVELAEKIYETAKKYGISKNDIIVDCLTMAVSTDTSSANVTLDALGKIRENGVNTVLGVSNISFGLPQRDFVNSVFFTMAMQRGLSAAIINPHSAEMQKSYRAYLTLSGNDENCSGYIDFAEGVSLGELTASTVPKASIEGATPLQSDIIKGLGSGAVAKAKELLAEVEPLDLINNEIVPALDAVGRGFEQKKVYLPQLLMSADAASAVFDITKEFILSKGKKQESKMPIVLASVQGDIHDIGKNIVKVLLDSYGYEVIDLGRDVAPDVILAAIEKHKAPLVGLSALMTTTVPAMEETVKLIKEKHPEVQTIVGGAVLTQDYADLIGADKYSKDAMETVRFAENYYKTGL